MRVLKMWGFISHLGVPRVQPVNPLASVKQTRLWWFMSNPGSEQGGLEGENPPFVFQSDVLG